MSTLRAVLVALIVVLVAFVAMSYVTGTTWFRYTPANSPVAIGTGGRIDAAAARERGAEVGEKVAVAAEKVKDAAADASLTSKIKAKMILDDSVKARAIDVTTDGSTVTLKGVVRTDFERSRAVALARDTAGVTRVVDKLRVEN
jgi:hyperosmotically inducible protein